MNVHNISKNLSIDDKTVTGYLTNLEDTGLINLIYSQGAGNILLRRPEKIFLNNTNLQYALENHLSAAIEIGTVRELFMIQSAKNAGLEISYSNKGDYQIDHFIFEVGGKNKNPVQLRGTANKGYLVKDDIFIARRNEIPLIYFGFLY